MIMLGQGRDIKISNAGLEKHPTHFTRNSLIIQHLVMVGYLHYLHYRMEN